ncbi:ASCH domain-containing protein [Paenibacillus alvei]|uniref:ASCH domain-containing protein n=1 Tax=Paenibacillus alvei TaxID=44250 RepID=UPI0018CEF285|nr:ASCH domain-containing protein [Paenibacillus alvei]MBG9734567.1 hypothetical protein [Paenibacillus alvei]MBG9743122.1 hypothetical protein [Paenibacillus alvei]MCY9579575.1 ASCH domain-containing protein [Paenibacillus alvei]MCY9586535.1 ASCH domain-containing protein [Paenibacillus alvei]
MKAITILQPWATLIALGEKKFETRGWATNHRGEIAIHAGKKVDKDAFMREEIYTTLQRHGILFIDDLPTGGIIAIADLVRCFTVSRPKGNDGAVWLGAEGMTIGWAGYMNREYHFGDYSDGRFAWELAEVRPLSTPIPAKGQQGLWNWDSEGKGVTAYE